MEGRRIPLDLVLGKKWVLPKLVYVEPAKYPIVGSGKTILLYAPYILGDL
jgi:hypothetical protein